MNKKEIKIISQKIINAEQEIALGKNVQFNKDKIEKYMESLSPTDLVNVMLYLENKIGIDNNEIF